MNSDSRSAVLPAVPASHSQNASSDTVYLTEAIAWSNCLWQFVQAS